MDMNERPSQYDGNENGYGCKDLRGQGGYGYSDQRSQDGYTPGYRGQGSPDAPQFGVKKFLKECPVTVALAAANVLVWIVLAIQGDTESSRFMFAHGAMWPESVLSGEYYRLFTATFLHFGPVHLLNNMLMLVVLGHEVEIPVGHVRFLICYLLSGLSGSLLSFFNMMRTGEYALACGASGAIFGIMGMMLVVIVVHKGRYERYTVRRLLVMIALSLYFGFTSGSVDNAGHVGGLVGGFVLCFLIYGIPFIIRKCYTEKLSGSQDRRIPGSRNQ